jgi:hypothetical protein
LAHHYKKGGTTEDAPRLSETQKLMREYKGMSRKALQAAIVDALQKSKR